MSASSQFVVAQPTESSSHSFPPSIDDALSISIVTYHPDVVLLAQTFTSLSVAFGCLRDSRPELRISVSLVDNGGLPDLAAIREMLARMGVAFHVISGHGNVGYGRGHNLAIEQAQSRYHLVLNPDIDLDPRALAAALDFLDTHPDVGLLTPRIDDDAGRIQYLCRRYPALLDFFIRGFLPRTLRQHFNRRLSRLEMRDEIDESRVIWDPPIVSGCFMLFRTDTLKRLRGFDPRYFLYFEDYDLSLRTSRLARIAYVPAVSVVHHGGGAARKGFAHIRMFIASAFRFYHRFGWKWL